MRGLDSSNLTTGNGSFVPMALACAALLLAALGVFARLVLYRKPRTTNPHKSIKGKSKQEAQQDNVGPTFTKVKVSVLFGTQSGTAEGFAKTVAKDLRRRLSSKADVILADLDEYGSTDEEYLHKMTIPKSVNILLMATYGNGEPTDNATRFCHLLERLEMEAQEKAKAAESAAPDYATPSVILTGATFAVFGLGDSNYEFFNLVARSVDRQMGVLGGQRLMELRLGDDSECMEDQFNAWKGDLGIVLEQTVEHHWHTLNGFSLSKDQDLSNTRTLSPSLSDSPVKDSGVEAVFFPEGSPEAALASTRTDAFVGGEEGLKWMGADVARVPVVGCRELHSEASTRSCLHLEFDISRAVGSSGAPVAYTTGDHVAVFPQNADADVARAAALLGLSKHLKSAFLLRRAKDDEGCLVLGEGVGSLFQQPMRLEAALKSLVDLHASPKKSALLMLAQYALNPDEAERLRHLASSAGKDEYQQWVLSAHRSLLEVLGAFPSSKPPLSVFLTGVAARLQPRFYSISSSPAHCPGRLTVTCAVVSDVTPGGRQHEGVCTNFLKRVGSQLSTDRDSPVYVPILIRQSAFGLPLEPRTPIIMVGPGTGLAPFRGFLQERQAVIASSGPAAVGPAVLFFGCRASDQDFIYRDELEEFRESGALTECHVAFSRQGDQKLYVQHLMKGQGGGLWALIEKGAHVYVCGDAKHMARDVHSTLVSVIQIHGSMGNEPPESLLQKMHKEGRYQRDVW